MSPRPFNDNEAALDRGAGLFVMLLLATGALCAVKLGTMFAGVVLP